MSTPPNYMFVCPTCFGSTSRYVRPSHDLPRFCSKKCRNNYGTIAIDGVRMTPLQAVGYAAALAFRGAAARWPGMQELADRMGVTCWAARSSLRPAIAAGLVPGGRRKPLPTVEELFLSYVAKSESCWLWLGATMNAGYGAFHVGGRNTLAHRTSYALFRSEIPAGLFVLHDCDNKLCVNPAHLHVGTRADNTAEAVERGRVHRPPSRPPAASITADIAEQIRSLVASGMTRRATARLLGVSEAIVYSVAAGRTWKTTQEAPRC